MSNTDILSKVTDIIRDILDLPSLEVTPEMTAPMVPGWDSMAQIKILMSIEEFFSIHFSSREMDKLRNVGDLVEAIVRHMEKSSL